MKRDMALPPDARAECPQIEGHEAESIGLHVQLMRTRGLLEALDARSHENMYAWAPTKLTWEGYDFLDSVRESTRWEETKELATRAKDWSFETIKTAAQALATKAVTDLV